MDIEGLEFSDESRHHVASDNNSPVHPAVLEAIRAANQGHVLAYGADYYTERARAKFREVFGEQCEPFFVFTGTAANVLSVAALTRSYHAVICAEEAHLNLDECGAPEKFAGVKLYTVPSATGKITTSDIEGLLGDGGDEHRAQPKVVSITQATEFGLHYTPDEIAQLCEFAHGRGLHVHMDGARLYTACAALGVSLKEMTADTGLDVLSLGGTKNGLLGAEAVVFLRQEAAAEFKYIRKQGMQLGSKMRFLAVQMEALLSDDLWLTNARHANRMARMLADGLGKILQVRITREVQTNMVYCSIPPKAVDKIRQKYLFYITDPVRSEARLVTNYDTTEEDVRGFFDAARDAVTGL
jgi:threonine aldolase